MNYLAELILAMILAFILGMLLHNSVYAFRKWQASQKRLAEQRAGGQTILERWTAPKVIGCLQCGTMLGVNRNKITCTLICKQCGAQNVFDDSRKPIEAFEAGKLITPQEYFQKTGKRLKERHIQ